LDDLDALRKVAWNVPGDIVTKLVLRPFSIRITRALFKTAITPTQITLASFVIRMLGAALFLYAQHGLSVLASCDRLQVRS
jgi:hypothetical protein